jgi:hypothetical protein
MWTFSDDRTEARLALPPIALEGLPKPLMWRGVLRNCRAQLSTDFSENRWCLTSATDFRFGSDSVEKVSEADQ